jgi:protein involved in ribonucleotide reduction
MQIAFYSVTGRVRDFVGRLPCKAYEISPADPLYEMTEPFVLILPTYERFYFEAVEEFLGFKQNEHLLRGVAGSGNRNFGDDYVFIAKEFSKEYHVPFIYDFEHSGTERDIQAFEREVKSIANTATSGKTERTDVLPTQ